jgi:hypothetical protein
VAPPKAIPRKRLAVAHQQIVNGDIDTDVAVSKELISRMEIDSSGQGISYRGRHDD